MNYSPETTGKIIRKEREKRNWSQKKLGEKINKVSGKQISNYENGITSPPIDILFKLCDVFNCELGYLLGEESYSKGTKSITLVSDITGLSEKSINKIIKITGTGKDCLNFGYESSKYRKILNSIIESEYFLDLVEEIFELDETFELHNIELNEISSSLSTLSPELLELGYNTNERSYETEDETDNLSEAEINAIHLVISSIDKQISCNDKFENNSKICRFNIQERITLLLNDLYPILEKNNREKAYL